MMRLGRLPAGNAGACSLTAEFWSMLSLYHAAVGDWLLTVALDVGVMQGYVLTNVQHFSLAKNWGGRHKARSCGFITQHPLLRHRHRARRRRRSRRCHRRRHRY